MHIVGTAKNNKAMIWATFEHRLNAPNGTYTYNSTSGPQTVTQNTTGSWTFCCSNGAGPFDAVHMQETAPGTITAVGTNTISPSDTLRWKAWGAASNLVPNPVVPTVAASNTEIISIDNNVSTMLASGDVRDNYYMTGATWTPNGVTPAPNGSNWVGTNRLANTTMETYTQGGDNSTALGGSNCFMCHGGNTFSISHIYDGLAKLFP